MNEVRYPNLRAEIARRHLTMAQVATEVVDENGDPFNSIPHFSLKMNGKYPFTLNEAFAIKKYLAVDMPLDQLFQPYSEA